MEEALSTGIDRFIPVSTGNTNYWRSSQVEFAVHPREHGEHACRKKAEKERGGSSP